MNESIQDVAESLHLEREWLRVTLASIGDGVITTDTSCGVTYLNPVAQSLTGWTQEDAAGMSLDVVFKIVNEESRRPVENPAIRALREGVVVGMANHTLLIAKDGTERPIEDSAAPIRDAQGKVSGVVLVFRDSSERRRQEQAIQDALAYADNIIATLREPFLVLDKSLHVVTANQSFYQGFQVTPEETQGRYIYDLGDRQWDIPRLRELLEEVLPQDHHFQDFAVEHEFPTIGRKVMLLNGRRIERPGNHSELILLAFEDVTERRRLEKQLQEQTVALADLHHRKDEFLAMLSHELRNPLAPIANAVQILRLQEKEDPLQHQARTIIERQLGQLTHLVDDLLEVSRITTGRIRLHRERLLLNGIVENGIETVRALIDQRRHTLDVSLSLNPIWLYADASRLEQVVVNLLTNAAKYTADGGQISVCVEQEGNEAVLRVRDTGVGIAPELLPRIFDLFTQAERSLDRSQGGLGIGLSLVKQLVEALHGGRVDVVSVLGQGSEFVVRLPIVSSLVLAEIPRAEKTEPSSPSLRILVVDDNADTAQSFGMLLKSSGHEIRIAHDGPTALEQAVDQQPDAILLDLGLPGMSGYEVAQRIRRQPALQGIVLIAMTGYGDETHRRLSVESGFDHHLVKPADFAKVLEIMTTVKPSGGRPA
ncbi:MAG TPA: ATP-binding protein [Thermoanaerobaculia bacterium]|jgi:PAS domain S-box-containing protein|nr:ATP-binding protein [Thermoanaerobaculia bacterium]